MEETQAHVLTNVNVPNHVVKATLLNPPRQEVRILMWNIGGGDTWFDVIDDGMTCRVRWEVPRTIVSRKKLFSEKRCGVDYEIWQGSLLETLRIYREGNNIPSQCKFYVQQDFKLPVECKTNKKETTFTHFSLPCGLEVLEIQLMGATVYGSTAVKKERVIHEEILSSSDDDDSDQEML